MMNTVPTITDDLTLIEEFNQFIARREFPCVAAKAANDRGNIECLVVGHMGCPKDDQAILDFLYAFVDKYRVAASPFHSAAIIFKGPLEIDEAGFDRLLWTRLQALRDMDAWNYGYDERVDENPASPKFSFSLKQEAFFIIGMSPVSSRDARRFPYPTLVFNPHKQFEDLRITNRYEKMQNIVRKKEIEFSGSINPLLANFGKDSEAHQYSGMPHDNNWQCPLKHQKL